MRLSQDKFRRVVGKRASTEGLGAKKERKRQRTNVSNLDFVFHNPGRMQLKHLVLALRKRKWNDMEKKIN